MSILELEAARNKLRKAYREANKAYENMRAGRDSAEVYIEDLKTELSHRKTEIARLREARILDLHSLKALALEGGRMATLNYASKELAVLEKKL